MTDESPGVRVRDEPDRSRYVVEVGGELAGFADYRIREGRHVFVHTEVFDEYAGRRLGLRLVRESLDDVRSRGGMIVPICPLYAAFVRRNHDYADLVDDDLAARLRRD